MTLILPVLPGLTWMNTKAPEFATKIQSSVSLNEVRIGMTPYPVRRYGLVYNFLRQYTPAGSSAYEELDALDNFFCNCGGSQTSFLYDDPEDDTIPDATFQRSLATVLRRYGPAFEALAKYDDGHPLPARMRR